MIVTHQVRRDFTLDPIDNVETLKEALGRIARSLSRRLHETARYSRILRLCLETERGNQDAQWILPFPVQQEGDVLPYLHRLLKRIRIPAPVTSLSAIALDLYLPAATAGNLFDNRAAEHQKALAATRQKLHARYGVKSLQTLSSLPVSQSEQRRELWKSSRTA